MRLAILAALLLTLSASAGEPPKETSAQFKARLAAQLAALDAQHQKAAALRRAALASKPAPVFPILPRRYNRLDQLEDELFWLQLDLDSR